MEVAFVLILGNDGVRDGGAATAGVAGSCYGYCGFFGKVGIIRVHKRLCFGQCFVIGSSGKFG